MKLPLITACVIAGSTWASASADVLGSSSNPKTAQRSYAAASGQTAQRSQQGDANAERHAGKGLARTATEAQDGGLSAEELAQSLARRTQQQAARTAQIQQQKLATRAQTSAARTRPGSSGSTPPNPMLVAAPVNDDCTAALPLVGTGTFTFDNTAATTGTEGQSETACNIYGSTAIIQDVWYTWTAPASGIATYLGCGLGSTIDTKVAVYPGAGCPVAGTALACDDDYCGGPNWESSVAWTCTAGSTYTLQIGNYPFGAPTGVGYFTLNVAGAVPLDDCSLPATIAGTGSFPFDTSTMTTSPQQAGCGTAGLDMWFDWTSPSTGVCVMDTCGTSFDTIIAAWAGSGCPVGPALACNDQAACPGPLYNQSMIGFPVTAGSTYTLQVGGWNNQSGPGILNMAVYTIPANDDCTAPIVVAGIGAFPFDNIAATAGTQGQTEALCLAFGYTAVGHDVWYQWTAPASGGYAVDTCGSGVDTKIAVYSGAACPTPGSALACNDDYCGLSSQVVFLATAGTTYMIQIGTYPTNSVGGAGFFNITAAPPPANDDCTTPTAISGIGSFPYDTRYATTGTAGQSEALCDDGSGVGTGVTNDVWFTWTATASGCTIVDNCSTVHDSRLAVYAGSGCPVAGTALACNDQSGCGNESKVYFTAVAGQLYTFQIGSWPGAAGVAGYLNVDQPITGTGNDDCSNATPVVGLGSFPFDNTAATTACDGQTEALCNLFGSAELPFDVWFTWTAPLSGFAVFSTCGSGIDTKIAAYLGTGCPTPGSAVACDDDACGWQQAYSSTAVWPCVAGASYTLQIGLYPWGATPGPGLFTLDVIQPPPPCAPWDDGTSENSIGFGGSADLVWMSRFGAPGVTTTVDSIDAAWGSLLWAGTSALANGDPTDIFVWQDGLSQDGNPDDATLLAVVPTTVQNLDTDILNNVPLPAPMAITGYFFAGTHGLQNGAGYPMPVDETTHTWPNVSFLFGNYGGIADYANPAGPLNSAPVASVDTVTPSQALLRVNCVTGPATYLCTPGAGGTLACPCSNPPAGADRGCDNKGATGGASITGTGSNSLASPTLTFTTANENATVGSVLIQGTTLSTGLSFGHGVRCAAGSIKRLYVKISVAGSVTMPGVGDPSIPAKSATLGNTILAGEKRWYQVYYRDTTLLLPGCAVPSNQFNVTNAAEVTWNP